jgi:uncharacterized protein with GYD domain
MGSNQSSQIKQTTEILNKSVTNVVNTNIVKAGASNSNVNSFEFTTGPRSDIQNCSINLGQKINASQQVKVMSQVSSVNDMKTMLKSAVDNSTSQNNEATSGFLSTAFNNQKSNTEINNILKNEIENNITNENLTECNALIDNINKGKLEFNGKWNCGERGQITINQEIVSAQVVECFANAAQEAIMQNTNIADAVNKAEQANTSKVGGVAEAISAVMGPYAMIVIAIVIAMVVAIPLLLFTFKSGGEVPSSIEPTISQFLKKASKRRY